MSASVVGYPMVEEARAEGRVAGVYSQMLGYSEFVPSIFKSLALCPDYLVLAWRQSEPAMVGGQLSSAAEELTETAAGAVEPPRDPRARELVAGFVGPLGLMSILAAGLRGALRGELEAPSARADAPAPPGEPLQARVASTADLDAGEVLGEIRAGIGTPIVNTIWRRLAEEGLLRDVWNGFAPQLSRSRPVAEELEAQAVALAGALHWEQLADRQALELAGCGECAPGMEAVLDAYVATLPRVLALAGSSASG